MDTIAEIRNVIRSYFADDTLSVTRETTAADVPGWDSLAHAMLMMEIEQKFGVAFDLQDVMAFDRVGDMADKIDELRAARKA